MINSTLSTVSYASKLRLPSILYLTILVNYGKNSQYATLFHKTGGGSLVINPFLKHDHLKLRPGIVSEHSLGHGKFAFIVDYWNRSIEIFRLNINLFDLSFNRL